MSEFVEVEWFGRDHKIGIVLTYDEHDGFKARMSPVPIGKLLSESSNIKWLMENAAKIPFEWAWGIFGNRMKGEWLRRGYRPAGQVRYDGRRYDVKTLKEVRVHEM